MVFFNYTTMEMSAKIVYYGAGLCGKTTNLQHIYDHIPRERRGEMVSLPTETDRTLFFDLLPLRLGKVGGFTTRLQLYTVPGQVFYNSTRKLVLKGLDGIVFVADSQAPMLDANIESLENLQENLRDLKLDLRNIPWVIQYNKRDLPNILPIEELQRHLNFMNVPSYESVAITGEGVIEALKGIARLTLQHLKAKAGYETGPAAEAPAEEIMIGADLEAKAPPPPPLARPEVKPPPAPERIVAPPPVREEPAAGDSVDLEEALLEVDDELPEELELETGEGLAPVAADAEPLALADDEEVEEEEIDLTAAAARHEAAAAAPPAVPPKIRVKVQPAGEPAPAAAAAGAEEPLTVVKTIRVPVRIRRDAALKGVQIELRVEVECTVTDGLTKRGPREAAPSPDEDSRVARALQDLRRLGSVDSPLRRRPR